VHSVRSSRFVTPTEETLALTVSVGATLAKADDDSGAVVLTRADGAMYEAKQSGGDTFVLRS